MQNKSKIIYSALGEKTYTQTIFSRNKNQLHAEDIGLLDKPLHALKEKKVDINMETLDTQKYSSRGKLYIIKRKA